MANSTITGLPAAGTLAGTEPFPVDQAGTTKKALVSDIGTYLNTLSGIVGSPAWLFGTGSDGSATLDGSNTVAWASKSGSEYTMTRDAHLTSLTVNVGSTIKTAGYAIFCTGTLTNNGTIQNIGSNATTGTGAAGGPGGHYGSGGAGGNGGTQADGLTGAVTVSLGGAGGVGGAGTGAGIDGGAAGATRPTGGLVMGGNFFTMYTGRAVGAQVRGGAGGGGGGGAATSQQGGGGGGGGGIMAMFVHTFAGNGTFSVNGGNGANAPGTNSGGGGGGGGGAIMVITRAASWDSGFTVTVAAGSFGNGNGTGSNGNTGSSGNTFSYTV